MGLEGKGQERASFWRPTSIFQNQLSPTLTNQEMALFPCEVKRYLVLFPRPPPPHPPSPLTVSLDSLSVSFPFSHLLKQNDGTGESLSVTAT